MAGILNICPIKSWLGEFDHPLVIGGPCSAESEAQVMETARRLASESHVKIFRSGIWKPRTRPGHFEGVGSGGLRWLKRVREETGLLTAVEVARPAHINEALEAGIDIIWIGARTVVNPFSLQDLANALRGIDIPVMVKNPVNPDLNLWIGALERINQAGIKKLVAIHRGFYFFERSPYRNAPMWEIPIELKRRFPRLPVICDPSHIAGETSLLADISQKALDLEMDGLMIETHPDPPNALTDPGQQITPEELHSLLAALVIRKGTGSRTFETRLEELRSEIDKIDGELITILSRRMAIVNEIGRYKKENGITILQLKRWSNLVSDRLRTGMDTGLDREFLGRLFEIVHNESIRRQALILNPPDSDAHLTD